MQGLQEVYGLSDDNLWHAATAFGGGIAQEQDVCGCITGGAMATSVAMGRLGGSPSDLRSRTLPPVKAAYDGFVARYGAADCRTLVGLDFGDPDQYAAFRKGPIKDERCSHFVRFMVEALGRAEMARRSS